MQRPILWRALPVTALIVAATLVVVLASQKRVLEQRYQDLFERARDPYAGLYLPAIGVRTLGGDSVRLGAAKPGHTQVLLVFNTTCEFCRATLPTWKILAARLQGGTGVAVYGISLDSLEVTRRYVAEHRLPFPVVSFTDRKRRVLYRSSVVPQTLVLDAEGLVRYARIGVVSEAAVVDSVIQAASNAPIPEGAT